MSNLSRILSEIESGDPPSAEKLLPLVELRYFAGLTGDQAAQTLSISPQTADRYWVDARAWIRREMNGSNVAQENRPNK